MWKCGQMSQGELVRADAGAPNAGVGCGSEIPKTPSDGRSSNSFFPPSTSSLGTGCALLRIHCYLLLCSAPFARAPSCGPQCSELFNGNQKSQQANKKIACPTHFSPPLHHPHCAAARRVGRVLHEANMLQVVSKGCMPRYVAVGSREAPKNRVVPNRWGHPPCALSRLGWPGGDHHPHAHPCPASPDLCGTTPSLVGVT